MGSTTCESDQISISWRSDNLEPQTVPAVTARESFEKFPSNIDIFEDNISETSSNRACENCRRKKRKCTFEKPTCYTCHRSNSECVYAKRKRKPGPEPGSKRLRNLDLLDRITTLEAMLKGSLVGLNNLADNSSIPSFVQAEFATNTSLVEDRFSGSPLSNQRSDYESASYLMPKVTEPQSTVLTSTPDLDEACLTHLLGVYFDHIQPAFPLFRRQMFFLNFSQGLLPLDLLTVMLALAARFSVQAHLFRNLDLDGWKTVLSRSQVVRSSADSDVLDLNTVKKECLFAVFEYAHSPGLKAWKQAGVMTRTAVGYGLHKAEEFRSRGSLADADMEELRFVWWTIWKLDICFNSIASTPLGTDDRFTNTYLVSTSIEDFTAGNVQPSSKTYLHVGLQGFERSLRLLDVASTLELETLNIYFTGLLQEVHTLRCRMSMAPNECRESLGRLRSACNIIRTCFRPKFFNPQRNFERQETSNDHRTRLMTLLQFHILRIQCHLPVTEVRDSALPLDLGRWQQCIGFAQEIVVLFQCWDLTYDTQVDPMVTCILWYTCVLLAIQAMSMGMVSVTANSERRHLETALDTLVTTLRRFSTWWSISDRLLESIEQLRLWTWFDIDSPGMQDLVERLRVLLDPTSLEPSRIHVGFSHVAVGT